MRIPARFAPILFSALLSAIMVCIADRIRLRSHNLTRNSFRAPRAVDQELYNDMANSFSNGRDCGPVGARNSRADDRLISKVMFSLAAMATAKSDMRRPDE